MKIFLSFLIIISFSACSSQKTVAKKMQGKSCSSQDWTTETKKTQGGGWNWYPSKSTNKILELAHFIAEGQALRQVQIDCKILPKNVKFHERCDEFKNGNYHAYVRASIKQAECHPSGNQNTILTKQLEKYQSTLQGYTDIDGQIERCNLKDFNSCLILANLFFSLDKFEEAIFYNKQGCDAGMMIGCLNQGVAEIKLSFPQMAKISFEKGCKAGLASSCLELAGVLNEMDQKSESKTIYIDLCNKGNVLACNQLASMAYKKNDLIEAKKFFTLGCQIDTSECGNLAVVEEDTGNIVVALELHGKACNNGNFSSCNRLGVIEAASNKNGMERHYYEKACDGEYLMGCYNLGFINLEQGNKDTAKKLYSKACSGGVLVGCNGLGAIAYSEGDEDTATEYFKMSCTEEEKSGCENLRSMSALKNPPPKRYNSGFRPMPRYVERWCFSKDGSLQCFSNEQQCTYNSQSSRGSACSNAF